MRQEGLVACQPRPKARTTVPAADLAGRPDLIERNFTADAPARNWWVISPIFTPGKDSCTWRP